MINTQSLPTPALGEVNSMAGFFSIKLFTIVFSLGLNHQTIISGMFEENGVYSRRSAYGQVDHRELLSGRERILYDHLWYPATP